MLEVAIKYLNEKIKELNYFGVQHEIVERLEREGQIYPAVSMGKEFKMIDLDTFSSLCYWRLSGEINSESKESETTIGLEYQFDIPLRFVGFKEKDPSDDPYFVMKIVNGVIGAATNQSASISKEIKAKRVSIASTRITTDSREVERREYENKKDYKADKIRLTHAYFSIDFNIRVITKSNCLIGVCADC